MDDPQKRQPLGRVWFFVQVENIRDFVLFENGVAPVHFANKFVQLDNRVVLVVNDSVLQMRQAFKCEVVHPEFRVNEDNFGLVGCVRAGDAQDDVLHEHGFAAAG